MTSRVCTQRRSSRDTFHRPRAVIVFTEKKSHAHTDAPHATAPRCDPSREELSDVRWNRSDTSAVSGIPICDENRMLSVMNDVTDLSTLSGLPPEAFADLVFNRYAGRLMQVAQDRLGVRLQSKVSPEDVVQSAFKSFFRRQHEFNFKSDDSDGLWGLLVVMTLRKCAKWADVFGADKRSIEREVSFDAETDSGHRWHEVADRDPGPEEAVMLSELIERLMRRLDARQQQMLSLRMQGFELDEIADQVQSSRRTVARVVSEVKNILRELLIEDA